MRGYPRNARVVGRTYFVDRLVAVVGLDREGLLALKPLVEGDVPESRGEVLVGQGIASEFGIHPVLICDLLWPGITVRCSHPRGRFTPLLYGVPMS